MHFMARWVEFLGIGNHQTHILIHLIHILVRILVEFVLDNVKVNRAFNDSSIIRNFLNDLFDGVKKRRNRNIVLVGTLQALDGS